MLLQECKSSVTTNNKVNIQFHLELRNADANCTAFAVLVDVHEIVRDEATDVCYHGSSTYALGLIYP